MRTHGLKRKYCTIGRTTVFLIQLLCVGLPAVPAWSQDGWHHYFNNFTLYWENDLFTGTDRD